MDSACCVRAYDSYDQALNRFDARLFGTILSAVIHGAAERLPGGCFEPVHLATSACSPPGSQS